MLIIFGGLPGTGKTTLSQRLARQLGATHIRIDTIEEGMTDAGMTMTGPEGYLVAYRVAEDNLKLGLTVIADSVNPIEITRQAWREVAERAGVGFVEVEVLCSSEDEHRRRVESRRAASGRGPHWDDVLNREYEPWTTRSHTVDTFGRSLEESREYLCKTLKLSV